MIRTRNSQRGYLLVTMIVMLFLVASVAMLLNHDSAMSANTSSSDLDAARSEYVAQAGMQHALWRAQNNTCLGDVTIPATTLGADNYTATVTGAAAGTAYTLTVDQDAWIRSDDVTKVNGTNADQHIKFDAGNIEHALTRFDISSLAAGAQINSATAWFYVTTAGPGGGAHPEGPITIHRVTSDWSEADATWGTMNGKFDASTMATIPAQPGDGVWVSFNLTGQVQAWANGQPNYGILMRSIAEGVHGKYSSREDGGNAPRLEVVVGSGTASPVSITATGTLADGNTRTLTRPVSPALQPPGTYVFQPDATEGIDAYIWEAQKTTNKGTDDETWVSRTSNNASLSLFKFNMGAVPAHARVLSATLSLHNRSGNNSDVPVTAHRITNPWDEDFVTWNNRESGTPWDTAGGDIDSAVIASTNVGPTRYIRYEWNITRLVQGWSDSTFANYGVALATAMASSVGERFDTSDHTDPTRRPMLTIEYACECGTACMAPQSSGNVLMPVTSTSNPTPGELHRIAMLESWGYVVDTTWEKNSQSNFDSAIAANDVVYVPATVDPANIGSKLTGAPVGVVSEHVGLNNEFGIATSGASPVGRTIDVIDASHYITQTFPAGQLQLKTVDTALASTAGTKSTDAQVLATVGAEGALVVLESGKVSTKGGTTTSRRVLLPIGDDEVSSNYLTNHGHLIVQRSLAWAMGANSETAGNLLLVVGNAGSPASRDADRKTLFESWGYTVTLIDDGADQAEFDTEAAANDVIYVTASIGGGTLADKLTGSATPIVNEFVGKLDNFGFSSGTGNTVTANLFTATNAGHYISEPFAGAGITQFTSNITMPVASGTLAPGLQSAAEIGALTWALPTLDTGAERWDGNPAPARRVHLPFGAANVSQLTPDGLTLMQRSLEWAAVAGGLSGTFLDEFNAVAYDGNDGTLDWSDTWLETGESDGPGGGDFRVLSNSWCASGNCLQIREDRTSSRQLYREANLEGALSAVLSLSFRRRHVSSPIGGTITLDISADGGVTFSPLKVYQLDTEDSAQVVDSFDITPYISANTQVRFSTSSVLYETAMYIDDVLIDTNGTVKFGPIAHWKLDDGVGTTAIDSEGAHTGTLANGPTWVVGQLGDALSFDGSNDRINVPHDNGLDLVSQMTLSAWVYIDTIKPFQMVLTKGDNGVAENYWLGTEGNKANFGFVDGGVYAQHTTSGLSLQSGQWHHIAATFDDAANEVKIYVDGVAETFANTNMPAPNGERLIIGNSYYGEGFDGVIDDVRIYNTALSAQDIVELASASAGGPFAHWKLDDGTGVTAVDSIGGHDGTLTNGPVWVAGQLGDALRFDGSNDLVSVPHHATFTQAPMTVSAWFKLDTLPSTRSEHGTIIDKRHTVDPYGSWTLYVNKDLGNKIRFQIRNSSETGYWLDSAASAVTNTWYHVVGTIDESYNAKLYVNGALESDDDNIGSLFSSNDEIRIGAGWSGGNRLDGVVDDVRFYDQALSAAEISDLYTAGGGGGGGGGGGCNGNYRDEFSTTSFGNNDGTLTWADDWLEVGESDGPSSGDVRIRDDDGPYQLWIRDNNNGGEGVERNADLDGASTATLSFIYRRSQLDNENDYVKLEISSNGTAGPWTELDRIIGPGTDTGYLPFSMDISAHASANTRIRLISSPTMGNQDLVIFDDIDIVCSP